MTHTGRDSRRLVFDSLYDTCNARASAAVRSWKAPLEFVLFAVPIFNDGDVLFEDVQ
jgi:hypothetical protein